MGIVSHGGKGADDGVFPTEFWQNIPGWYSARKRVCLADMGPSELGNGAFCIRHRGKTIDMRGIFVEARIWFLGKFGDMGSGIEHRRRLLLSLGCNEDGQLSGGFGAEFQPVLDEKY